MSQTSIADYGFALSRAQRGQLADLGFNDIISRAAEGTVPFGAGLTFGTDPEKQCKVIEAGDTFRGVAVFSHAVEQGFDASATNGQLTTGAAYLNTRTVSMLRKGRIYVGVNLDVEAEDAAYVDVNTDDDGQFTYAVNRSTIEFDANFITANEIDMTINGEAITTVTFATSHAATFAALVEEIEDTLDGIAAIGKYNVESNAAERWITIEADVAIAVTSAAVTSGASQADTTVTEVSNVSAGTIFNNDASAGGVSVIDINLP